MQLFGNTEMILVVDDEPDVRSAIREMLERTGYKVLDAENFYQAMDLTEYVTEPIDLMVVDVSLPGPNGCELANRVLEKRPDTKVLFISGYTGAEIMLQYGVPLSDLHFLAKPFTPAEFIKRVRTILDEQKSGWDFMRTPAIMDRKRPPK